MRYTIKQASFISANPQLFSPAAARQAGLVLQAQRLGLGRIMRTVPAIKAKGKKAKGVFPKTKFTVLIGDTLHGVFPNRPAAMKARKEYLVAHKDVKAITVRVRKAK